MNRTRNRLLALALFAAAAALCACYLTACTADDRSAFKARVIRDGKTLLLLAEKSAIESAAQSLTGAAR